MKRNTKLIGGGLGILGALVAIVLGVTTIKSGLAQALYNARNSNNYSLTLNSTNKVTSVGDIVQKTAMGNNVTFTYANVAGSTSGHVTLNNGGTLVNKDWMRSITAFTCVFSNGTLNVKAAYGGNVYNDGFDIESGHRYETPSYPYFLKFTSTGTTTITSIHYEIGCFENPDAHENDADGEEVTVYQKVTTKGSYTGDHCLIVCEESGVAFDGSLSTLDVAQSFVSVTIENNLIAYTATLAQSEFEIGSNYVLSASGKYIYGTSGSNKLNESTSKNTSNTITIDENGDASIVSNTSVLRYNAAETVDNQNRPNGQRFRYYKAASYTNQKAIAIYEKVTESAGPSYDKPKDCVGFTATDSKANSYNTTDVYDTANGLSVEAHYSDGSSEVVSKGVNTGYSYVVKDSSGNAIDSSIAFGGTRDGNYTVVVSYKNFIPIEIPISVKFVVKLTEITVNCGTVIFNTAEKLSDYTSGITADLVYNKITSNAYEVAYSSFSGYKVSLVLVDPNGVGHDINAMFGTAGKWKVRVVSNEDNTVYGEQEITVNAILVTTVTVTGSETSVEEGKTLQLNVAVAPGNATDQTVTWSSNHTSIATVNTNGLVTGVSEGTARITATANDGSAVYGYIDVTVTPKPAQSEFEATMAAGTKGSECTINGNDGIKVGTSSVSGDMSITVGAGATKLAFYAVGWNGESVTLSLTGATCSPSSISLNSDSGASNNSPFTLSTSDLSKFYCEVTLSNISTDVTITLSTTSGKRFIVWDAKYYIVSVTPTYPTSISLSGDSAIDVGATAQLTVNYTPSDINTKHVTFSSSNTSIATVSSDGIVTGVAAGTVTITATAETANNGTTSATKTITVSNVKVSSVELNKDVLALKAGATEQLTATISPSNAYDKTVSWSSSNTSVATVSNGLVRGVAEGTAVITVTTQDGNKTDTCTVTVKSASSSYAQDIIDHDATSGSLSNYASSAWASDFSVTLNSGATYYIHSMGTKSTDNGLQWNSNGYLYSTASDGIVTEISVEMTSGKSIEVYGSNTAFSSNSGGTSLGTITGSGTLTPSGQYEYIRIKGASSGNAISSITIQYGTPTPIDPTAISIAPSTVELGPGGSKNLSVTYTPSNANQNKDVTWSRYSGSSNITVSSDGKVSVASGASANQSAVIRATLSSNSSIYASCTVTVVEQAQDDQTILIYICGSDLESNGQTSASSAAGYASGDITEILKVADQPDDVNVVIETGGAKCWQTTHGINKNYLERYHVANKKLVRDSQETKASMGLSSTLRSFVTWGVQTYPADRVSLILWNHGGAMRGVCYDENYSSDCLTNSKVKTAISGSFTDLGRSTSDKFEWIGYDACLMQVQDIAEFNSTYFNYMVASEESEAGAGWDYDNWLDDAYAKKTTPNILKAICDSFLAEQGSSSDQTLSYLDLSYMAAYKSTWETMASTINSMISSYGKSNFQTLMKSCQYYGSDSDCEGYSYFGILDAKDVVNKIRATSAFSSASTQTSAVLTAFNNLVAYSMAGTKAGNSYGLCCFFPMKDGSGYTCSTSTVYTSSQTNFSNWRSIVTSYGD